MELTNTATSLQRPSVADNGGPHSKKLRSEQCMALRLDDKRHDLNLSAPSSDAPQTAGGGTKATCREQKGKIHTLPSRWHGRCTTYVSRALWNPSSIDVTDKTPIAFSHLTHNVFSLLGGEECKRISPNMAHTAWWGPPKEGGSPKKHPRPSFHSTSVPAVMSPASSGLAPLEKPDYVPAQSRSNFIPAAEWKECACWHHLFLHR